LQGAGRRGPRLFCLERKIPVITTCLQQGTANLTRLRQKMGEEGGKERKDRRGGEEWRRMEDGRGRGGG